MLSARTSFAALTTEFASQTRSIYAAVELLGQASVSLTLKAARSRNLAENIVLFVFQTRHSDDGRNSWKISSFRKLEIEPNIQTGGLRWQKEKT